MLTPTTLPNPTIDAAVRHTGERAAAPINMSQLIAVCNQTVTAAFATNGKLGPKIPQDEFMGKLTGGEMKGLEYLLRGGFLLFRNATAHRNIQYTAGEAEGVINLVNHCLRFIPPDQ